MRLNFENDNVIISEKLIVKIIKYIYMEIIAKNCQETYEIYFLNHRSPEQNINSQYMAFYKDFVPLNESKQIFLQSVEMGDKMEG